MVTKSLGLTKLFVVGDARIETPKGLIAPSAEFLFATALYLILERSESVSRRALQSILWPTTSEGAGAHRLRQTFHKLRQAGFPIAAAGSTRISLERSSIHIDFEELLASPQQLEPRVRSGLSVLPGYEPNFSEAYLDWLDVKRREIGSQFSRMLLARISQHRTNGNWEAVETWAAAFLQLTPSNEEATLALAESYAMRGSKIDGMRILDRYLANLDDSETDLRLPASVMRRRIADRMLPRRSAVIEDRPLVGRGETISRLVEMLSLVRSGHGQSCLIDGDAGIGKSRVFAELSTFASLQGLICLRVQCRPSDSYRPLSVFVDLVPALRSLRGAIGCSPETLRNLDRLTTHRQPPTSAMSLQGDAEFAYASVQQALFDLIDAVADEAPLLILVEDVQRLDDVSAELFRDLIPWAANKKIFFTFTGRARIGSWVDDVAQQLTRIKLEPLDDDSAQALMLASVDHFGGTISPDYLQWCVRVAEGNPYFLTELANHWVQTGEKQEVPPSLTAVISQRLAILEQPALQLLQVCALLESNSTLERIEKILGYPQHQLLQSINELSSLNMIVLDASETSGELNARLSPRHELLANAADSSLAAPAKAFLHRRIGLVLEAESDGNNSSAILWDCAKHWRDSGDLARAYAVARSCANHLMEIGLCAEAAEAYEKALSFCRSVGDRLEILEGQAQAYFRASDWENLSGAAAKVRDVQRHLLISHPIHDDIELMDIRGQWQRGYLDAALERSNTCLMSEDATLDHRCRAGIMSLMLFDMACDFDGIERTFKILRPLTEDATVIPSHRFEAGMVYETLCGNLANAVPLGAQLVASRRESPSIADLMRALTNAAVSARVAGEFDTSDKWLLEAVAIADSHRLPLASEIPMQLLASMALDRGDIPGARHWYDKLSLLCDTGNRTVRDSIGLRIALSERDVGAAKRLVHGSIKELSTDPIPHRRTYGLALLVSTVLAEGSTPDKSSIRILEESYISSRRNPRQGFATFVLVAALRRSGNAARGDQILREYVEVFRRETSSAPLHILELMESFATPSTSKQRRL
jgi:DNA-binding SARP family transcriptional activator/tetratricopeptide (TPR) repeat protein